MPYKEKPVTRMFYSIGEVARMFDVKPSLIRFWEKEFDIIRPSKNKKGNRMFTQQDVDNFHVIFHLVKERGFTLPGARQKLQENREETLNHAEIVRSLHRIRNFLTEIKNEL